MTICPQCKQDVELNFYGRLATHAAGPGSPLSCRLSGAEVETPVAHSPSPARMRDALQAIREALVEHSERRVASDIALVRIACTILTLDDAEVRHE